MKKLLIVLGVALLVPSAVFAGETPETPSTPTVATATVQIGERPLWRKLLRGAARVATLGMVQASADTVKANQPFTFMFDHDGIDTDGYQTYINGAAMRTTPVSALINGSVSVPFTSGLPKGSYTFKVHAYGPGGEGISDTLSVSVTAGNPSAPRNPRINKGGE